MEPVTITILGALIFGAIVAVGAFIRQLIISRDKKLNDKAQHKALEKETEELARLRTQMESPSRFDSHYKVLGSNKDAIVYLDNKIEELIQKKFKLIERYGHVSLKESSKIIKSGMGEERKHDCDKLKGEISREIETYDKEIAALQKRRASLWDSHSQLQNKVLEQEALRNKELDTIYQRQTQIMDKMYLRHVENSEAIAKETLKAGNITFKSIILAPFKFLKGLFTKSKGLSLDSFKKEKEKRTDLKELEDKINKDDKKDDDLDLDSIFDDEYQSDKEMIL